MTVSRRSFLVGVSAIATAVALPTAVPAAPVVDRYVRTVAFMHSMVPEMIELKAIADPDWKDLPQAEAMFARWSAGIQQIMDDFPEECPDYGSDAVFSKIFNPDITVQSLRDDIEPGILPIFLVRHMITEWKLPIDARRVPSFKTFAKHYREKIMHHPYETTSLEYLKIREQVLSREGRQGYHPMEYRPA